MIDEIETLEAQLAGATDLWQRIDLLNALARALQNCDTHRAIAFGEQAEQLARQSEFEFQPYQSGLAASLRHLGELHLRLSNYDAALSYALEALSLFEDLGDLAEQAAVLSLIATIYMHLSIHPDSLAYFIKARRTWEKLGDRRGEAAVLNSIGYLYMMLADYDKALAYLMDSLEIFNTLDEKKGQADVLVNCCNAYEALLDSNPALLCGQQSVRLYREIGDGQGEAEVLISIGRVYQRRGDYAQALAHYSESLRIFQEIDRRLGVASVLLHIGKLHSQQAQLDQALSYLQQALTIAEEISAQQIYYECHLALVEVYRQVGDFEKAFFHYEQYHTYKETVFNEETDQRLKSIEVAHQVEAARQEAEIVRLRNVELEQEVAERKHAEAAMQASAAKTAALYQLTRALALHDSLPATLQSVVNSVTAALAAEQVVLHLFDLKAGQVTHVVESRPGLAHPYRLPFEGLLEGVIGWAVRNVQPVLSSKVRPDPRESPAIQQQRLRMQVGAVVVVPLYYRGIMFGTLTAINRADERDFTQEDLTLLLAMGSQTAIAISDARRSEEMARLKEFNENIVQGVGEAILLEDAQGFITFANPAAETLLGYASAELIGQHWTGLVSRDVVEQIYAQMVKRFRQRHGRYETTLLHKDGHQIPVIVSALTLLTEGKVVGVLAAFTDITERKLAEEALQQRSAELEAQNAELDAFAHTVAHDLKNPLTTLMGFSDVLETRFEALSEERRRYCVQSIGQIVHKMDEIVDGLLLLARVRGIADIAVEPLDMGKMVAVVCDRLKGTIEEDAAEVVLPASWPAALGYGPWIEEVWANYLSNAIKYGGQPPRVELGATLQEEGGVRFWVRDNGEGLTPEQQRRLFTPFERLHNGTAPGHGLGLSIVRRIVEKLGGQVGVEGGVGQGCCFWFTLPGVGGDRV